jgi:hypothetical protein
MVQFTSADGSVLFIDGGLDENGDHIIYAEPAVTTTNDPFVVGLDHDVANDLYWDDVQGTWVLEHGIIRRTIV